MDKIEEIINALTKTEEELKENISLEIEKNCKGKNKEEIREYLDTLLNEPPGETGGQNAITGFYFQLLCSLYYLAEVLEKKWDFIVLELHQDIVVGNESTIRFIQVKSEVLTDRKSIKQVSETALYRGWIQKLLSLGRLFPKGGDVNTQFELITNFMIKDSPRIKVEDYLYNPNFNLVISDDDNILNKVIEYKTTGIDSNFDFEISCNETIKELLSRFSIRTKARNQDELEDFKGAICSKFGRLINESAGVSMQDINYLIGELCFECNHGNQGSLLYIDEERALGYLEVLKQRASKNLERFYTTNNNDLLIEEIIENLNVRFRNLKSPLKEELEEELDNFCCQLKKWANEDISVTVMVHRYLVGKKYSISIGRLPDFEIKRRAEEIFKVLFILNILSNQNMKFSKNFEGILMKEVIDSNINISILGLDPDQTFEEAKEKLSNIVEKATDEEKLLLIMQDNKTVIQGDYDEDGFNEEEKIQLNDIMKKSYNSIRLNKSLKEVDSTWTLIPGKKFTASIDRPKKFENMEAMKNIVHGTWSKILK